MRLFLNELYVLIHLKATLLFHLRSHSYFSSCGFSLLEIMIALALFGFVILGMLAFFPQAYRLGSQSQQATHGVFIAEEILNILKASAPQGALAIGPEWKSVPSDSLFFSLTSPSTYFVAYDTNDQPRRVLTLEEYQQPLREEGVLSLASVTVTPAKDIPSLSQVNVTIATPASAPEKERRHVEFSLLLQNRGQASNFKFFFNKKRKNF